MLIGKPPCLPLSQKVKYCRDMRRITPSHIISCGRLRQAASNSACNIRTNEVSVLHLIQEEKVCDRSTPHECRMDLLLAVTQISRIRVFRFQAEHRIVEVGPRDHANLHRAYAVS